jgi:hypothetical protein
VSEQAPDMTLDWGTGWIVDDSRYGYVAIDHAAEAYAVLPGASQRALRIEDQRARREAEEAVTDLAEQMANKAWALQRSGHQVRSGAEVLAGVRWRAAEPCSCGHLELCRCPGETMADRAKAKADVGNRPAMRARQLEREAAMTPEQRELRELRGELTHLRARLHAQGVNV